MNPTLYNWFIVDINYAPVKDPETFTGPIYVTGQIIGDHRGRPDGRWVSTSRVNEWTENTVQTNNTSYVLDRPAAPEIITKLYSGEYGGDRGEAY